MPEIQAKQELGTDIRLLKEFRYQGPDFPNEDSRMNTETQASSKPEFFELKTVSGKENMQQAIMLRLLSNKGVLSPLGHPEYGGHLLDFIGANNPAYLAGDIKQNVEQDPRIERLSVETSPVEPGKIGIGVTAYCKNDSTPVQVQLRIQG